MFDVIRCSGFLSYVELCIFLLPFVSISQVVGCNDNI